MSAPKVLATDGERMTLFLGVDGGQSSTTALIGDETGQVLGAGRGGPCNHVGAAQGREKLAWAVVESVKLACLSAGPPLMPKHAASKSVWRGSRCASSQASLTLST